MLTRGRGSKKPDNLADVIYEWLTSACGGTKKDIVREGNYEDFIQGGHYRYDDLHISF